ncbi:MAG: CZB domain-containing protein [Gammaproteobacteria bacterium]
MLVDGHASGTRYSNEIQMATDAIQRSLPQHRDWLECVVQSLTGGAAIASDDLADEAHRLCTFGRWLYREPAACMDVAGAIAPIEEEHARLHGLARQLLRERAMRRPVSPSDVHRLMHSYDTLLDRTYCARTALRDMLWRGKTDSRYFRAMSYGSGALSV